MYVAIVVAQYTYRNRLLKYNGIHASFVFIQATVSLDSLARGNAGCAYTEPARVLAPCGVSPAERKVM